MFRALFIFYVKIFLAFFNSFILVALSRFCCVLRWVRIVLLQHAFFCIFCTKIPIWSNLHIYAILHIDTILCTALIFLQNKKNIVFSANHVLYRYVMAWQIAMVPTRTRHQLHHQTKKTALRGHRGQVGVNINRNRRLVLQHLPGFICFNRVILFGVSWLFAWLELVPGDCFRGLIDAWW